MDKEILEREIYLIEKIRVFLASEEGLYFIGIIKDNKDLALNDVLNANKDTLQKSQGELIAYTQMINFIEEDHLKLYKKDKESKLEEE